MVALSGVGTQPQLTITPASLAFGMVAVGATTTESLTLRNTSASAVDGLNVNVTAGFRVGSSCGLTTLDAGSSCAVSVTFAPTASGTYAGTLTIGSTDPASPVTMPLSGTATAGGSTAPSAGGDVALTVNGGSSASVTVTAGHPATYALAITPTNGYGGVVALTCTAVTPAEYTACSLVPASITLTSGTQTSSATVATLAAVTASADVPAPFGTRGLLLCCPPAFLFLLGLRRQRRAMLSALLLVLALSNGGCGGNDGVDRAIRYASPGSYTFHVTATSTTGVPASKTVTLNLVITQR